MLAEKVQDLAHLSTVDGNNKTQLCAARCESSRSLAEIRLPYVEPLIPRAEGRTRWTAYYPVRVVIFDHAASENQTEILERNFGDFRYLFSELCWRQSSVFQGQGDPLATLGRDCTIKLHGGW